MNYPQRNQPGVRAHHSKYNIDAQERRRLAIALKTITDHEAAFRTALDEVPASGRVPATSFEVFVQMRFALRLLVEGPNGEFK